MSIAGGYYRAVERARECGCDCVQLFTKNNNQWRAVPIEPEAAQQFQDALRRLNIRCPAAHSSYLINLASPDRRLRHQSIDACVVELQRAATLGIPYVVLHPGAFTSGTERQGLRHVIQSLNAIHRQIDRCGAQILLENTAGQGTSLGWRFEQLATIFDGVKDPERLGVCFDTCHAFAAGYAMQTRKQLRATIRQLDELIGLERLKMFHLNDSKRPGGSRVDRHEHIGHGHLGLEPFRLLLADRRFRRIPMYLETPKGKDKQGRDWDSVNIQTLRSLVPSRSHKSRS